MAAAMRRPGRRSGHRLWAWDVSASSIRQQLIECGRKSKHPDDAGLRKMAPVAPVDRVLGVLAQVLMTGPYVLDIDNTVKPLYGHQEGAELGYNPQKPGRPSHNYHTYFIGLLRLVLRVEVHGGKQHAGRHSMPGPWALLDGLCRKWTAAVLCRRLQGSIGDGLQDNSAVTHRRDHRRCACFCGAGVLRFSPSGGMPPPDECSVRAEGCGGETLHVT